MKFAVNLIYFKVDRADNNNNNKNKAGKEIKANIQAITKQHNYST